MTKHEKSVEYFLAKWIQQKQITKVTKKQVIESAITTGLVCCYAECAGENECATSTLLSAASFAILNVEKRRGVLTKCFENIRRYNGLALVMPPTSNFGNTTYINLADSTDKNRNKKVRMYAIGDYYLEHTKYSTFQVFRIYRFK